jgi:hypothetical protein
VAVLTTAVFGAASELGKGADPRHRRRGPGGHKQSMAKGRSAVLLGSGQGSVTCAWGRSSVRGGGNEGVWWEAAAPCIEEGGRWLTGSEEDRGFNSLSNCDLDGDGMQGGRKEVSVAAERSECSG